MIRLGLVLFAIGLALREGLRLAVQGAESEAAVRIALPLLPVASGLAFAGLALLVSGLIRRLLGR